MIEKFGFPRPAVKKIPGTGIHIARHAHKENILIERRRSEREFSRWEDLLQLFPFARELFLPRIDADAVPGIHGREKFI